MANSEPNTHTLGASEPQPGSWAGMTVPVDGTAVDDLTGTTLNDTYAVERVLGEGGMGRVYLAQHARISQKRVAIKVLHLEFSRNSDVLARFQREAEAAACISHPNVVGVFDVDRTERGLPYLVCEYLQGIDLADHLKKVGKLELGTALHIARQLCRGLAAAHERGVIHRDLKPQNVFLVGDFSAGVPAEPFVKILDFGLSKFADADDNQLTKTGVIMGTPSFMPPEQALGQRATHLADIYGVGAILYTMLTGRSPFDEETPQSTVLAVMANDPARPRSLEPSISEQAELVIERAMAKNPAERYASAPALEQALEKLQHDSGGATSLVPGPPSAARPPLGSRIQLDSGTDEVRSSRPRLLLYTLAASTLFIAGAATAITGAEQASHLTFSRFELTLALLAVLGSCLTPAVLWVRHVHHTVWDNSSRVLALLGQVRAMVWTSIAVYGLGMLALRLVDDVLVRLVTSVPIRPLGATWPGWDFLLVLIALTAAVANAFRRKLGAPLSTSWIRRITSWIVVAAALCVVGAIVWMGLRWKSTATSTAPAAAASAATP